MPVSEGSHHATTGDPVTPLAPLGIAGSKTFTPKPQCFLELALSTDSAKILI